MDDRNPLTADLEHVMVRTEGLWEELRGQRLFITGGTGFWGCWLLESFVRVNDRLGLDATAVVLTRNAEAFERKAPHLASHPAVQLCHGDVRSFEFPSGSFSHVIHAAAEASAKLNTETPLLMLDTIVEGTRHVLEFARRCGAGKFLFASSGAVYGKQPSDISHVPEEYAGAPDTMTACSAYGEGKRLGEHLCALYGRRYGIEMKIARGFAFVGPYLPLGTHFAVGNFIFDGMRGGLIRVKGDGTPYRSYLYAADLAVWLWTILFRGQTCSPYNVGSERQITIAELANTVGGLFRPTVPMSIARKTPTGKVPERYVPSTQKAFRELGLRQTIDLQDSIRRTVLWHRMRRQGESLGVFSQAG